MKKQIWSKIAPHVIVVVLFIIGSYIYFNPVFDGKVVIGHDNETWAGMSQEAATYNATHDNPTLWTNSMFGGMPTYQIAMSTPSTSVSWIYSFFTLFPRPVYYLILYLIGFYIMLLAFRVNPWLSFAGAIALAFASYNFIIIAAGHSSKAIAIAYMAPVIGSVVMAFRGKRWWGAILTAVFLALGIKAGHPQISYYVLIILAIYAISELIFAIREKTYIDFLKTAGALAIGAILAVGLNATSLITTNEYGKASIRGQGSAVTHDANKTKGGLDRDYITGWSYGIGETFTLMIPNFYGGASNGKLDENSATAKRLESMGASNVSQIMKDNPFPLYWGEQPVTSGPVYVGSIICFLFVLGMFLVDNRYRWWLFVATVLSIMLAWGKNFPVFTNLFIDYFPWFNKFRSISMILVIAGYCMPILGVLAIQTIVKNNIDSQKLKKSLYWSTGITGGLCLLFWIIPSLAGNFISPGDSQIQGDYSFLKETLPSDRESMLRSDAFRSLVFILLSAGVIWLFMNKKLITKALHLYLIIAVLLLADMYPVAKRYLNDSNFRSKPREALIQPTAADNVILQDKSLDYRVLNLTASSGPFNDASTSYFHKSIGGYHGAKLRSYQDLIDVQLMPEINSMIGVLQKTKMLSDSTLRAIFANQNALNMLNMKYVIVNPNGAPLVNPYTNGSQWFVSKIIPVATNDAALQQVGQINTKKAALVEQSVASTLPVQFGQDTTAAITMKSYEPNKLIYSYNSKSDQIAVFSEIYYGKGWNAYINGAKVPYFRANYLLRAMHLNAGQYDIEFRFEPSSYSLGNHISLIASILLALFVLGGGFLLWKNSKKAEKVEEKEIKSEKQINDRIVKNEKRIVNPAKATIKNKK